MTSIAVIGGGYSGAAFAIHMSRVAPRPVEILLIEPRARLGTGIAHSTGHPDHRLNAADSIHLLYLDEPEHFSNWLRTSGALERDPAAIAANGRIYPRRADFGAYVCNELDRHRDSNPSGSTIRHVSQRAVRASISPGGASISLDNGDTLRATACVLAVGQGQPHLPDSLRALAEHRDCVADPWDLEALRTVEPDRNVLILGAGLTAADVIATLVAQGHRERIDAVSRRGMRPTSHSPFPPIMPRLQGLMQEIPEFVARHGKPDTVARIVRALRADIARLDQARASWHAPFDDVRDASHVLWPNLSTTEQMRFLRHLKPWYDVHRFRIPPQIEEIVERMVDSRQLAFHHARVRSVRRAPQGFAVEFEDHDATNTRHAIYSTLINCTGFDSRLAAATDPLVRGLAADGLLRASACGLGVDVDADSRAIGVRGALVPNLYVIGPLTGGSLGEASSVPVITRQILQMMPRLVEGLPVAR
ncbi:MAG: FAD/NAD(P)-binding protein [Burkholderiales bacterium]